jgi:hypothetical protein
MCRWGGCDSNPGFNVETCISSWSSVAVGDLQSDRTSPTFVFTAFISSQRKTDGPRIACSSGAAAAKALKALGAARIPNKASRFEIIIPSLGIGFYDNI